MWPSTLRSVVKTNLVAKLEVEREHVYCCVKHILCSYCHQTRDYEPGISIRDQRWPMVILTGQNHIFNSSLVMSTCQRFTIFLALVSYFARSRLLQQVFQQHLKSSDVNSNLMKFKMINSLPRSCCILWTWQQQCLDQGQSHGQGSVVHPAVEITLLNDGLRGEILFNLGISSNSFHSHLIREWCLFNEQCWNW